MAFFKLATKSILPNLAIRTTASPKTFQRTITVGFPQTLQRTISPLIGVQKLSVGFRSFLPAAASRFFSDTADDKNTHMLWSFINAEPTQAYNFPDESVFVVADVSPEKVIFLKMYNGEGVRVQVNHWSSKLDWPENSKGPGTGLYVTTVKGDDTQLHFFIRAFDSEIEIDHIALLVPKNEEDFLSYRWMFSDLDENLQAAFYKYLAVRGVTSTLCNQAS